MIRHRSRVLDRDESEDPLYFCHLPKTAGTSVTYILDNQYRRDEVFDYSLLYQLGPLPASEFEGKRFFRGHFDMSLPQILGRPVRMMTWLRDPVERTLSEYHFLRTLPPGYRLQDPGAMRAATLGIRGYIEAHESRALAWNLQCRMLAAPSIHPETTWMAPGEVLSRARANLETFEFVGIAELMGESVDALCLQYGIKPLELPPRVNSTPRSAAEAAEARGVLPLIGAANRDDRELYCLGRRLFRARWMESVARLIETGPGGPIQDALAPLVGAYARGALPYGEIRPHLLPLIEDLYELCHADDPELDEVEYNFDEPLIGEGWHARERTANRTELPYRWIGPLPWATIHFRLRKGVAYRLRFRCCLHLDPGVAKSISVHANGQALPVDRMEAVHTLAGEKLMYEARIPAEATAGPPLFLKLTFVVARTMKPSEMDAGSADNRALGVALDWISIAPLIARADPAARTAQAADLAQAV